MHNNLFDASKEDNPIVWCDRCQRMHEKYTWTKQDEDALFAKLSQEIADQIDKEILDNLRSLGS